MEKNMWSLQDAKSRFSEVVREAIFHGPQKVTRHGEEAVIILSLKDYKKLVKPKQDIVDFFRKSPLHGIKIDLERKKDFSRNIEL